MAEKVKDKTVLAEVVLRKRNARTFDEKQTSRLISEWIKYPCLFEKCNKVIKDYHDRNKRDIAKQQTASTLNESFDICEEDAIACMYP